MKMKGYKKRSLGAVALLLGCLTGCKMGPVDINEKNFPDANFREFISDNIDSDEDGKLSSAEIEEVTKMDVSFCEISDLTGIEWFSELVELNCHENLLTELDISKNRKIRYLDCTQNQLAELDVSKNPDLMKMDCRDNQLQLLDLSKNPEIYQLFCSDNQLTTLILTENPRLDILECANNQLTKLDITKNRLLNFLSCHDNQLDHLDLAHNPLLSYLMCERNPLKELDACNCASGIEINADQDVKIYNVDKEPNKGCPIDEEHFPDDGFRNNILDLADADANGILSEREANSVEVLFFVKNTVKDLKGLEYFPLLTFLHCDDNEITHLDLSANVYLQYLFCNNCGLEELDLSKNSDLRSIECGENRLKELDVSECERLLELICNNNQLKELNCRNNRKLERLGCGGNPLTYLDIRNASRYLEIDTGSNDGLVIQTPKGKKSGSSFNAR